MISKEEFASILDKLDSIERKIEVMKNSEDSRLYNVTEAARILGISTQTLHAYIRAGYVEPLKINGSNKFTREIINTLQSHDNNHRRHPQPAR